MSKALKQVIEPDKLGLGYYVLSREYLDEKGNVVKIDSADAVSKLEMQIMKLHLQDDLSLYDTADKLGMPVNEVKHIYYKAHARDYEQVVEAMNARRYEMYMRYERQYFHLIEQQRVMPDNLDVVNKINAVLTSEAKLLGLDAPQRVHVDANIATTVEDRIKTMDAEYVELIEDAITREYLRGPEA